MGLKRYNWPRSALERLHCVVAYLPNMPDAPHMTRHRGRRAKGYLTMKVREIIRRLEADGWYYVGTKGSHRQYKHSSKPGRVTILGHLNDEPPPKTLASIFQQAQLPRP